MHYAPTVALECSNMNTQIRQRCAHMDKLGICLQETNEDLVDSVNFFSFKICLEKQPLHRSQICVICKRWCVARTVSIKWCWMAVLLRRELSVYNFGFAILRFSGQAPYNWAESNKSNLMVLRDHLLHKSEGCIALWIGVAYIDVMSPASHREVESKKWSPMNTWVFWRLWNWKASLCFLPKKISMEK